MALQESLEHIQRLMAIAGASREVKLVAVSKTFGSQVVMEAYQLGLRDFGENKVQELLEKQAALPDDIRWHMIGRLQTNKVKEIVGKVALIHSLDRVDLFEKIEMEARKQKIVRVECLLQVNVSGEETKAGFPPEQVDEFLRGVASDSPVKIVGLMTMAPMTEKQDEIRNVFRQTKILFDRLRRDFSQFDFKNLSMGMSGDFKIAIEEGATMIRIGSALFGNRSNA